MPSSADTAYQQLISYGRKGSLADLVHDIYPLPLVGSIADKTMYWLSQGGQLKGSIADLHSPYLSGESSIQSIMAGLLDEIYSYLGNFDVTSMVTVVPRITVGTTVKKVADQVTSSAADVAAADYVVGMLQDAQAVITTAITACSNNGTVQLAAGTYTMSTAVVCQSGVNISGPTTGTAMLRLSVLMSGNNVIVGNNVKDVVLTSFTLDSNSATAFPASFTGCGSATSHGVSFKNMSAVNVAMRDAYEFVACFNFTVDTANTSTFLSISINTRSLSLLSCKNFRVRNCTLNGSGIGLYTQGCSYGYVINTAVKNTGTGASIVGGWYSLSSDHMYASGLTFGNNAYSNISWVSCNYHYVLNSQIIEPANGNNAGFAFCNILISSSNYCTVAYNTLTSTAANEDTIIRFIGKCIGNRIIKNVATGNKCNEGICGDFGAASTDPTNTISWNLIAGNVMSKSVGSAGYPMVYLRNSRNNLVTNNKAIGTSVSGTWDACVGEITYQLNGGTPANNYITGNEAFNCITGAYTTDAAGTDYTKGNIATGTTPQVGVS